MPYHLVVSADSQAFQGNRFEMPAERCLEFTESNLQEYFFRFGETRVDELLAIPALIVHEHGVTGENARLVRLTEILRRGNRVRALFDPIGPQIEYERFRELSFEL